MDFDIITDVVNSSLDKISVTREKVIEELQKSALSVVPSVISHQLRSHVNSMLVRSINVSFDPGRADFSNAIFESAERSKDKVVSALNSILSLEEITKKENELIAEFSSIFDGGSWSSRLPGREILRKFISSMSIPYKYEVFRNMILNRMAEKGIKPPGMLEVLEKIAKD